MRTVNVRVLLILIVVLAALGGGVHFLHAWQTTRTAAVFKDLGAEAAREDRFDEAADYLERYLALVPDDLAALEEYSEVLHRQAGDRQARTQLFLINDDLLRRVPQRHDVRRRQVELAMAIGRTDDALAHLDVLRRQRPDDGELAYLAGRCHEHLEQPAQAIEDYREATRLAPALVDAYERLAGLLRAESGNPQDADAVMDGLIAANPDSSAAYAARARDRHRFGSLREAASDARRAVALDPHSAEAVRLAGALDWAVAAEARQSGNIAAAERGEEEVRALLTRGVGEHPDDSGLRTFLAGIEAESGDRDAALRVLQDGLERRPQDPAMTGMLVELLIIGDRLDEAQRYLDGISRTDRRFAGLRHYLAGRLSAARGEWHQAMAELEAARAESAAQPDLAVKAGLQLAACCECLGRYEQQAEAYRRVLETDRHCAIARLGLAALFRRSGRLDEAIGEYRQVRHLAAVQPVLVRMLIAEASRLPDLVRDWAEVEDLLQSMQDRAHDPVELALLRAEMSAVGGRWHEARAVLETALAGNPDRRELRLALDHVAELQPDADAVVGLSLLAGSTTNAGEIAQLAIGHVQRGRIREARAWLARLEALEPRSFSTLEVRVRLLAATGNGGDIVRGLEEYVADDSARPTDAATRLALAAALAEKIAGTPREPAGDRAVELSALAEDLYRRCAAVRPAQIVLLTGYLMRQGRTQEALEVVDRSWDGLGAENAVQIALTVLSDGNATEAQLAAFERRLARAIEQQPQSLSLRTSRADLLCLQGRYGEAESAYRAILSSAPQHVLALNNLAWLLALRGDSPEEALALADRAIAVAGPTPQLLDTRACAYLALRRAPEAVSDARAAIAVQPSPAALLHLAASLELAGNASGAEAALREARQAGSGRRHLHPLERQRFDDLWTRAIALSQAAR